MAERAPAWHIFLVFLRLGLTSFGGPIAHLAYFRTEFVDRRRWLGEGAYADLVALCQFLPGPASSQVGMGLGLMRGGYAGALAAWAGFTLPSALLLTLFALGIAHHAAAVPAGALHGLKVVAVAVVAQAVWGMARNLCTDVPRVSVMAVATCAALMLPAALAQVGIIALAGVVGLLLFQPPPVAEYAPLAVPVGRRAGVVWLLVFFGLLAALPALHAALPSQALALVNAFYRAGALVFGGGHVVLPLLQAAVVTPGWVDNDAFLAGYGAAQAIPGPLTSFAAFLGASLHGAPTGWSGAMLCLVVIFAPSFMLVMGALPFWEQLRRQRRTRAALAGINAAVVGLLLAALYQPVWTSAVMRPRDFGMVVIALVALMHWRVPPWLVVLASGVAGWLLA
ncbi:chromate transporter [Duganella sp. 1224]|uniref:chromate efflux transporter n=1 Tax=Duganella sp. 1224 TaxID=2587052 RepID=UPI0015CDD829|nr:chromate efflux transporter [Duganella sp. 1224]NYE61012.1 chromate transporter [Duganella sp. 1224]